MSEEKHEPINILSEYCCPKCKEKLFFNKDKEYCCVNDDCDITFVVWYTGKDSPKEFVRRKRKNE